MIELTNALITISTLTCTALRDLVGEAKDEIRRDCDAVSSAWQILILDDERERIGDPVAYSKHKGGLPSLTLLRDRFAEYPDAKYLVVEGQGYYFQEGSSIADRWDDAEPSGDWWQLEIGR